MCEQHPLLEKNQSWAEQVTEHHPEFFQQSAEGQAPEYLWLGCADSRVPASVITKQLPGEIFVHRNIANVMSNDDDSYNSVLQYAVTALKVKQILVVGHYGCGGVQASLGAPLEGTLNNWLNPIRNIANQHAQTLAKQAQGSAEQLARLCELNALEQAHNVCQNPIVQNAWQQGQDLTVRSWIYDLAQGKLLELGFNANSSSSIISSYQTALETIQQK